MILVMTFVRFMGLTNDRGSDDPRQGVADLCEVHAEFELRQQL